MKIKIKKILLALFFVVITPFILYKNQFLLQAQLFFTKEPLSKESVFIPTDIIAEPNELGEVSLYVGRDFPEFIKNDVIGISFDIEWDARKIDFFDSSIRETIFDTSNKYSISYNTENLHNGYTHVEIWTSDNIGTGVDLGDRLANVMFKIKENTTFGEEVILYLNNVEVIYDGKNLKTYTFKDTQNGVIKIGNPYSFTKTIPSSSQFFFDDNILSKRGEEKTIVLRAAENMNLAGFVFDLSFPSYVLKFLSIDTKGTALENNDFEIIYETKIENHLGILGASSNLLGSFVNIGDPVLSITFLVDDNANIGSSIPLQINNANIMSAGQTVSKQVLVDNGSITISEVSSLRVVEAIPLSSSSIRIVFSDDILEADLKNITFSPPLKNNRTTLEIEGKSIVLRKLTTMLPDDFYRVDINESVIGNISGTLSSDYNFSFFLGFPAEYPSSNFWINAVQAISEDEVLITFSDKVNPQSIEISDFIIDGISIISVNSVENNEYQLKLKTTSQNGYSGSMWLSISNTSEIHDLVSQNGENLSLNIFSFTPYNLKTNAPKVEKVLAKKSDKVEVYFDKPVLGSSIASWVFNITENNKIINIVDPRSYFSISNDHKIITLSNVKTKANKQYKLQISPGEIRGNDELNTPLETVGNLGSFFGQGSFFTTWDFGLESVETISSSQIKLIFSEEISNDEVVPTNFMILTRDSAEFSKKLKIIKSEKIDKNIVILDTEEQIAGKSYFVLVDPKNIKSTANEILGVPSSRGFLGFTQNKMRVISIEPEQVSLGKETELIINGVNFPDDSLVRINDINLNIIEKTSDKIKVVIPSNIKDDFYDVVVYSKYGIETVLNSALAVIDEEFEEKNKPKIIEEESYANPYKIPNDGSIASTLWVLVEDIRGVSDIEKVTADLRIIGGNAVKKLELHKFDDNSSGFVDNKAWYKLEVTVPSNIPTSEEPVKIPITVENKTGRKGYGYVSIAISRDLDQSILPEITMAKASPEKISPDDNNIDISFLVEVQDKDGAENIAHVILDGSSIGIGLQIMKQVSGIAESRECRQSDYIVSEWSECKNSRKTRTVTLKNDVICSGGNMPESSMSCEDRLCVNDDWVAGPWGPCINGEQRRSYDKKPDVNCNGDSAKPQDDTKSCDDESSSIFGNFFNLTPKVKAEVAPFGNKTWFTVESSRIPDWIEEGNYNLPVTVIDREGGEVKSSIKLTIARNITGVPEINEDSVFVSPDEEIPNDGTSEFQIFAKVQDPNGNDDIETVVADLSSMGLPPVNLQPGQKEGSSIWYSSQKLIAPKKLSFGLKPIKISVVDKSGNNSEISFSIKIIDKNETVKNPIIKINKSFTNPRAFKNDGKTTGVLYVFVEKGDSEIKQVTANLGTVAKYIGSQDYSVDFETSTEENSQNENFSLFSYIPKAKAVSIEGEEFSGSQQNSSRFIVDDYKEEDVKISECKSTDTFVCLLPSINEGGNGRWYYIPNIVVSDKLLPSDDPYFIDIVATDINGEKHEAEMGLFVTDGVLPKDNRDLPYLVDAISTDRNRVEVLFSSPLESKNIKSDAFKIVFFEDMDHFVPIRDVEVRADVRSIVLRTNSMLSDKKMTLIADTEKLGLRSIQRTDNQINFDVFSLEEKEKPFVIESIFTETKNSLIIKFNKDLEFTKIINDGSSYEITEKGTNKQLSINSAYLGDDAKNIILSTETQRSGAKYILKASNVYDFSGGILAKGRNIVSFDGFKNPNEDYTEIMNSADFNKDGKIDFSDFSIFATAYGLETANIPDSDYADLNNDGRIDFVDFSIFAQKYDVAKETNESDQNEQSQENQDEEDSKSIFDL